MHSGEWSDNVECRMSGKLRKRNDGNFYREEEENERDREE